MRVQLRGDGAPEVVELVGVHALVAVALPAQDSADVSPDQERLLLVRQRRTALEEELKRLRGEEKSLLGEVEQLEVGMHKLYQWSKSTCISREIFTR